MRNPTRRSRNIGTAKQGHGQHNTLLLPTSWNRKRSRYSLFCENLRDLETELRCIGEHQITFLTEKLRPSVVHACSIDDIVRVLSCIPPADLIGLDLVILRQPKRKEEILSPVWGRYLPYIEIQKFTGSAIILEAMDLRRVLKWKKPLHKSDLLRLEKLRSQGHRVVEMPRHFEISSSVEAVRETQLYETLPHEVGHHVHSCADEHFYERTKREKEDFAEKYERQFMAKFGGMLKQIEVRPAPRILN